MLVDLPERPHEGVVLAVADRGLLVFAAVDLDLERSGRVQPLCQRQAVIEYPHGVFDLVVAQYVGDDVGQVFGRHQLLLVAQLDHPFGHLAHRGFVELDAQRFEVLQDVGLARGLAQGVFAYASEAFGQQLVEIEVVLVVAVGMDACTLRKDVLADDRAVARDTDARVGLDHAADVVDLRFVDAREAVQPVVQHGHRARQGCVSCAFAQPVYGYVNPVEPGFHRSCGVGHGQVVIVMGMEVEPKLRIACHHVAAKPFGGIGVEDTQRVGAHEALHGGVGQPVEYRVDVPGRILHTVRPVFEVDVHLHAPRDGPADRGADVAEVLLRGAAQLFAAVFERPLRQQVHHAAPGLAEPVERHAAVDESQRLDAVGITLRGSPFGDAAHGLLLALRNPRRGDLDAAYVQFLQQQPGDGEFFAGVERNPRRLLAVAQRGIHYLYAGIHCAAIYAPVRTLRSGARCCAGSPRRRSRSAGTAFCMRRSRSARCGPWRRSSASGCPGLR